MANSAAYREAHREEIRGYMKRYYREHSERTPMVAGATRESKQCPSCAVDKVRSEFSIRQSGPRKGHLSAYCKSCAVEKNRRVPERYARIGRPSKLKSLYGITVGDYDRMLAEQRGGCAICGSADAKHRKYTRAKVAAFSVDHDHKTGKVRGLLCSPCNRALGLINDNPSVATRMASYLSR